VDFPEAESSLVELTRHKLEKLQDRIIIDDQTKTTLIAPVDYRDLIAEAQNYEREPSLVRRDESVTSQTKDCDCKAREAL
jgi:hypothetical protein